MNGYAHKCDQCGKIEFVEVEQWEDKLLPKGWLHLFSHKGRDKDFCSEECVRQHFKLMREVKA